MIMRGKGKEFYADNQDIINLLKEFDGLGKFQYVARYSKINKNINIYYNAIEIFKKAICTPDRTEIAQNFFIFEINANIVFREITFEDGGGKKTALDTWRSDDAISIAFGGEVGDNTLIMSDIGTVADNKAVLDHFKHFKKLIEARSVRIGLPGRPSYLMPGAVQKAKQGWRLARGKALDIESDPVLPPEQLAKL
jgi:hypothetical protein